MERRLKRLLVAACAAGVAACARAEPAPPPAPPPAADTIVAAPEDTLLTVTRVRWAAHPLPITNAFRAAVERGTRTLNGRPGPRYWQQHVEYRIAAELDPETATLQGDETIVYHNNSPDTLSLLVLNLYQNVFAPGEQRTRRVPITGGITLERVAIEGMEASETVPLRGRASYRVVGTLMWLTLPEPLPPGGTTTLEVAWHFVVPPRGAPRTGHNDREVFVVAQWYPQIATYDDIHGWHDLPYWSNGEFYLEYGDFEVSLTVPEGWIVTATGTLDNPTEVLTPEALEKLNVALSQDEVVHVITTDELEAGEATAREPGGQLTWRYTARGVRDFAFATSNRYLWDATRAVLPDANGDGRQEVVAVHALYRPEAQAWREAAVYMRHAVSFHANRWHPYPYPKIAAAEGPIGGMEYPMLVFIGAPAQPIDLYAVLSHEIAHQWWSMVVGSNETRYAWQDEGLTTYVEDLSVKDYFPDSDPAAATQESYLRLAGSDNEKPIMTQPDLFGVGAQYVVGAYTKPGTLFRALAGIIGPDRLESALRVYARRWQNKHPAPWDLFNTIEDVAGRDLDWFWTPWFFETATLDQAIVAVNVEPDSTGERIAITVEDQGEVPMPVPLRLTLANGDTQHITLPVEPWLEWRIRQRETVTVPAPVERIEIDAEHWFPDIDRQDNSWTRR